MKIKALIFDLDGTLCDTLPMINKGMNMTRARFGLDPIGPDKVLACINEGPRVFVKLSFPEGTDEETIDKATALYTADYESVALGTKEGFPGMEETLKTLKANGCHLAVLTNKPHDAAVKLVHNIFGTELFEDIYGVKDKPLKPMPDTAWMLAEKYGAKPEECCFVGDSHIDMQTGVNAKMHVIGMSYGYKPREVLVENGADFIADRAPEILDIVKTIENA